MYATGTTIAVAYTFPVRLRYIAVAYRNFYTPRKTIPLIAIFQVVRRPPVAISLSGRVPGRASGPS
jgi:hypothetical protein